VQKNQDLALGTNSTVLSRTPGQLLRRNLELCLVPWLRRCGLAQLLLSHVRTAASDLALSDNDLRRSRTVGV
jgi:hypothetical protein